MDLEDWELLPQNNYKGLDLDHDEDHAMTIIKNTGKSFDSDYFICPTQDPAEKTELHGRSSVVPTQLLQVPITWEPISTVDDTDRKNHKNPDPDSSDPDPELLMDSVPSPRITFKTRKETEFVDMKHYESEGEYYDEMGSEVEEEEEEGGGDKRLNMWKMGLHGIGAICSFGVAAAAATICVFFLGHNNNNIHSCRNKNQLLRFQIYSDDNQHMKEVVKHATKLNEAISVMKGLPVARAQISFGGYYDGL